MKIMSLIKNEKEKQRNPNIDFIKILGMFAIIIHHLLFHGEAIIKYKNHDELHLLNIFCMWHVSSFGIVSGIIGIKTHKFSNLFYLWIMTIFYSFIIYIIYSKLHYPISNKSLISNIFPVIHKNIGIFQLILEFTLFYLL